ncbi:MAG: hypothetical protein VZR95_08030 [Alphaproteobacteria bacterium]
MYQEFCEELSKLGINEDNIFDLMKVYMNWLKMKERRWISTPCQIVYRGQDDRLIILPFLITDKTPFVVWGIEIGKTCFCLNHECVVPAPVVTKFDNLRRKSNEMFRESFWLRDFERQLSIPTVQEIRKFAEMRSAVEETTRICNRYGYKADLLTPDTYWVTDEIGTTNLRVAGLTEGNCRIRKQRSSKQTCRIQPVIRYNRFKDLICSVDEFGVPIKRELENCLNNMQ